MNLLDFVIKISLQGSQAAKQLGQIMNNANRAKGGLNSAGAAAAQATGKMNSLAGAVSRASGRLAAMRRNAGKGMRFGLGSSVGGVAFGGSGSAAQAGLTAALGVGFSHAVAYEDSINSTAVTQQFATAEQQRYSDAIMEVSKRTGQAPALLAQLGDELAKAGAGGKDAAKRVENLTVAAEGWTKASVVAGDGMQRLAADAGSIGRMTGLMVNNFGLSGDKLQFSIAQLAQVSNDTTLDLNNMVMAMSKIAPEVAAAGGSFSQALLLATISARSGKSASLVGGQGASFLKDMRDPKKQKKLNALGIKTDNVSQQALVSTVFERYLNAKTQKEKNDIVNAIGRYGQGMLTALNGMDPAQLEQTRKDVSRGGSLDANYLKRQDAMKQKITDLGAAWDRFMIRMSEAGVFDMLAGVLDYVATKLEDLAKWVKDNKKEIKEWLPTILKVVAFLWLFGKVLGIVSALSGSGKWSLLVKAFGFIRTAITVVGTAIMWLGRLFLANPILAVIALIAAAAYYIWSNWDWIGPKFWKLISDLKAWFLEMWHGITSTVSDVTAGIVSAFSAAWGLVTGAAKAAVDLMIGWIQSIWGGLKDAWTGIKGMALGGASALANTPGAVFGGVPATAGRPGPIFGGGPQVVDNRRFNFNGNGDAYLRSTAKQVARGTAGDAAARRNGRR